VELLGHVAHLEAAAASRGRALLVTDRGEVNLVIARLLEDNVDITMEATAYKRNRRSESVEGEARRKLIIQPVNESIKVSQC